MISKFYYLALFSLGIMACAADPDGSPESRNLPTLQVSEISITEQDVDDTLAVMVNLVGQNEANAIVRFAVIPGTAQEGLDYTVLSESRLVFGPGENSKTIQIVIFGDGAKENTETITLQYYNPINVNIGSEKQVITVIDDDDNTQGLEIPSGGYSTPKVYEGYKLVWADEFDSTALNPNYWVHETGNGDGGWGNNELQYYREDNTSMVNGNLVITAKKQKFGGFDYTSSRIKTQGKKSFKFGRVDIRAALPKGQGVWPALWMLGTNITSVGWPACGEIDIMELTGDLPNRVLSTVHFGANVAQRQYKSQSLYLNNGKNFHDEFHVFTMIWKEDMIEFFVDDMLYHTITPASVGNQPYPFNKNFFFIMNVAIGGNLPGNPDASTELPQNMIVDYIRVFQPQ